jgi:hypothetical protein
MKKTIPGIIALFLGATMAFAQTSERWLHVRVVSTGDKGETVRVNVPMSVAEQVLPAIHTNDLNNGIVKIKGDLDEVDLRAILDAVSKSPDNEFVTVQNVDEDVRVAKSGPYLLVKVTDRKKGSPEQVDVKVPISVVNALISGQKDELNVLAGLRALKAVGDLDLVTVKDKDQTVRIWVDARSTAD